MKNNVGEIDSSNFIRMKFGIIGQFRPCTRSRAETGTGGPLLTLPVLITGETGTGKEVFANALHGMSKRNKFPFVSVNCGAIPETLLESELFGHEKGAFTGANDQRKGFFEVAHRGTIFLDEMGEMPVNTQVKLLRILESGEFSRLGSSEVRKVDVRIVAATNRTLEEEVQSGNFRQDLFFRLNSVHIILPPLRNHVEDIPLLVEHFGQKTAAKLGISFDGISGDALNILRSLNWPGNVRELRNLIETAVTLEEASYITPVVLRPYITRALPAPEYKEMAENQSLVRLPGFDEPQKFELEIIFRTLLELKNDVDNVKRGMQALALKMDSLKADIIELERPVEQVEVHDENKLTIDEENLNIAEIEKGMIILALRKHHGNRRRAAQALGISERTLYRKLLDYEIHD